MISWHNLEEMTNEQREYMHNDFRAVFSSAQGKMVLTKILTDLCFFRSCENDEERWRNNYAKQLLSYITDWDVGDEEIIIDRIVGGR